MIRNTIKNAISILLNIKERKQVEHLTDKAKLINIIRMYDYK